MRNKILVRLNSGGLICLLKMKIQNHRMREMVLLQDIRRGGSLMMVEVKFDKNAIGDPHTHPHEQVSYIASGSFEFTLEGEKQILKKGDSVYIPANAIHETVALEDDSIILDVFTPQREDFL